MLLEEYQMGDELNNTIKQLTDLLNQETLPDNLKGILSLLGSQSNKQDSPPKANEGKDVKHNSIESSDPASNGEKFDTIMRVMSSMNSANDPRINLLSALKPFMNKRRQKNINNCINIVRISKLATLLDDNNKGEL
jgi:hypothetical protein